MTIYGYARVSTTGQDLTDQKNQLSQNAASIIYAEKITGAKRNGRNELTNLLEVVQPGDQILVKKIDCLARSIRDLREIVDEITSKGASIKFLDDNMEFNALDKASPIQTMMLNMLGSFAEFGSSRNALLCRAEHTCGHSFPYALTHTYMCTHVCINICMHMYTHMNSMCYNDYEKETMR